MQATSEQVKAIEQYVLALQKKIDAYYTSNYRLIPPTVSVNYGQRFAKVIKIHRNMDGSLGQRFVHSFIEIETGDIYKAATWNAPAKHVRGNINARDHGMSAVTEHGANYLR